MPLPPKLQTQNMANSVDPKQFDLGLHCLLSKSSLIRVCTVCTSCNNVAPTDFGTWSYNVMLFQLMLPNKNSDWRQNSYQNQKLLQVL